MILIADSGSTKTTWACIQYNKGSILGDTSGINPFFLTAENILQLLKKEFTFNVTNISSVYFYGTGCIPENKKIMHDILESFFQPKNISIESDLLGAARSLFQNNPGIACILGTGSNSAHYDGTKIVQNIPPLGFILGDEGSGAALGKNLISDILKNQMPENICKLFFEEYSLSINEILDNVYRKPLPNRFLAQFTKFIQKHINKPEIDVLVNNSFQEFISRNILQYNNVSHLPVSFTGSIAYIFRTNLKKLITNNKLINGTIEQNPVNGLIQYHLNDK